MFNIKCIELIFLYYRYVEVRFVFTCCSIEKNTQNACYVKFSVRLRVST